MGHSHSHSKLLQASILCLPDFKAYTNVQSRGIYRIISGNINEVIQVTTSLRLNWHVQSASTTRIILHIVESILIWYILRFLEGLDAWLCFNQQLQSEYWIYQDQREAIPSFFNFWVVNVCKDSSLLVLSGSQNLTKLFHSWHGNTESLYPSSESLEY